MAGSVPEALKNDVILCHSLQPKRPKRSGPQNADMMSWAAAVFRFVDFAEDRANFGELL
jgi:hypothetical protein